MMSFEEPRREESQAQESLGSGNPSGDDQETIDRQLKLAALFHYIYAGLIVLASLLFLLYFIFVGALVLFTPPETPEDAGAKDIIGGIFLCGGLIAAVVVLGVATLHVLTGRFLKRRKHYMFCMLVSVLACLSIPIGLVVGVFTLLQLSKDSVKAQFDKAGPESPPPSLIR